MGAGLSGHAAQNDSAVGVGSVACSTWNTTRIVLAAIGADRLRSAGDANLWTTFGPPGSEGCDCFSRRRTTSGLASREARLRQTQPAVPTVRIRGPGLNQQQRILISWMTRPIASPDVPRGTLAPSVRRPCQVHTSQVLPDSGTIALLAIYRFHYNARPY